MGKPRSVNVSSPRRRVSTRVGTKDTIRKRPASSTSLPLVRPALKSSSEGATSSPLCRRVGKTSAPVFIVAPGASNKKCEAVKACLRRVGDVREFVYPVSGTPNLFGRREVCLDAHLRAVKAAAASVPGRQLWLAGLSFGSRCAAELLSAKAAELPCNVAGLVALGYPLVALGDQREKDPKRRKQDRSVPLLNIRGSRLRVLLMSCEKDPFLGGDRGDELRRVAANMKVKSRLELLPGRHHNPVMSPTADKIAEVIEAFVAGR
eukprot:TRINITY_DN52205_c0_g1_i1.p1 TRINITY_DN52205_c0_g1~~TRINITY_DN52205_c0_g1_i1.p1  ORF type:complete len:263 (+),score=34.01 TRINITY_DN52205_c0_g1_i1:53-841(+)